MVDLFTTEYTAHNNKKRPGRVFQAGGARWTITLQMLKHDWMWHLGNTLEHFHSVEGDISLVSTLCESLYSRLWGYGGDFTRTVPAPEGLIVKGQTTFGHTTSFVCFLQSYTFSSKYYFSCIAQILTCCVFVLNHSKYFLCDYMFIVALTHFRSAQPTLTEYMLCT